MSRGSHKRCKLTHLGKKQQPFENMTACLLSLYPLNAGLLFLKKVQKVCPGTVAKEYIIVKGK